MAMYEYGSAYIYHVIYVFELLYIKYMVNKYIKCMYLNIYICLVSICLYTQWFVLKVEAHS